MRHSFAVAVVCGSVLGCGSDPSGPVSGGSAGAGAGSASAGSASVGAGAPGNGSAGAGAITGVGTGGVLVNGGASGSGAGNASSGGAAQGAAGSAGGGGRSAGGGGRNAGSGGAASSTGGTSSGSAGAAGSDAIVAPAGYKLVWHDEFDVDGPPSTANYNFEHGFVRNEEDQWYQDANASVQGGLLVIEARKETVTNPNYTGSGDWKTTRKTAAYTSSSMTTSGKQSFQYGHFEMRGRIPTDAGMWPAWWTLGVKGEWPSNGEIDIMEYYKNNLLANVACGTSTEWQAKWDSSSTPISSLAADWASNFHVWTMDWDETSIVLSVDGKVLNTSALSSMLNSDGTSPFKQKAYLLVNLAIGGQNGGDPSKTTFPQRYEVDYLRVFQKQ